MSLIKKFKRSSYLIFSLFFLHFALLGTVQGTESEIEEQESMREISSSFFPILMYDSDIGFGFGGRGIVKNLFKADESFDLILFASTLGEQWYVFTFSIPDFEIRQGKRYGFALDLKLEFDKYLNSNYFGFGNDTVDNDWQFPSEMLRLELTLGHAFTEQVIAEAGLILKHMSVYGYEGINPLLDSENPGVGEKMVSCFKIHFRWDTRDSQINPGKGWKLAFNSDFAGKFLGGEFTFQRYRLEFSKFQLLFAEDHILALRVWLQHVDGDAPYFEQSIIGGGWTARGYKMDRFVDRAMVLTSVEYRYPIIGQLGGIVFIDAGRVFDGLEEFDLVDWKISYGGGLRYYLENFVARFDVGISDEGTRIFFNFGHVF